MADFAVFRLTLQAFKIPITCFGNIRSRDLARRISIPLVVKAPMFA